MYQSCEIRRILRPHGWFAFSTHLLPNLAPRFTSATDPNATPWHTNAHLRDLFERHNRHIGDIKNQQWAMVRDAAHAFALLTYYVRPAELVAQLDSAGFAQTRFFAGYEEHELAFADLESGRDNWAYVLTRAGR